ncbi:MAG: carbamoyltransferase family protein [Candidatus Scalindua sp.]
MIILGVTHPISWNNGACILVDGKLIAMVEEERFNRFKHSPRVSADMSIEFCLKRAGVTLDDVDYIAIGWESAKRQKKKKRYPWDFLLRQLPFRHEEEKMRFVNHHVAHALSSYYVSGYVHSNIISLDGYGGSESGILAIGEGDELRVVKSIPNRNSWGHLYGEITRMLGFKSHSDEGKVMGLAAYGQPIEDEYNFIDWDRDIPVIDKKGFKKYLSGLTQRKRGEDLNQHHKDLAATVQHTLERATLQMSSYLHNITGSKNLCVSGGCALNCSMNGVLLRSDHVDNIFIQPAAHDIGTALGAAVSVYKDVVGHRPDIVLEHPYYGPDYTNEEVEYELKRYKLNNYKRCNDIAKETAALIADNKTVGWFQGRMEFGPRALGGRSILANPKNKDMKDIVNKSIKGREPWRPFAPSFLAEDYGDYVKDPYNSPFMIIAFQTFEEKVSEIASAVHVDNTVRVQTVRKEIFPRYWELINEFKKITGVPALLNTSFNVAGQPIVCSPRDAIMTFFGCGLDYLAIEDYLVWK